ncbi:MAG: membrane dipeptidase, partial [Planctomycetota bacterium]|nr:membrane dipeptidase [Planctomycetota bacterium]
GMIGVNLVSNFLDHTLTKEEGRPAKIADVTRHIEHICELAGNRTTIGLGSDMDGGFSAEWLPEGIRRPANLSKITDALAARGWSEEELEDFRWRNWARFFERNGPGAAVRRAESARSHH